MSSSHPLQPCTVGRTASSPPGKGERMAFNHRSALFSIIPALVAALVTLSCLEPSSQAGPRADPRAVASIGATPLDAAIRVGQNISLSAHPYNAYGQRLPLSGRIVTWTSNNQPRSTATFPSARPRSRRSHSSRVTG